MSETTEILVACQETLPLVQLHNCRVEVTHQLGLGRHVHIVIEPLGAEITDGHSVTEVLPSAAEEGKTMVRNRHPRKPPQKAPSGDTDDSPT